jgi:glycosyltransferase involved in cell wall biosynthesis
MRLLALVPRPLGRWPNQRFRLEGWAPHLLRDHGITVEFAPFESPELGRLLDAPGNRPLKLVLAMRDTVRRWMLRPKAKTFDGAVVVHEAAMLGGTWFERYLARHGIPFIYDFDDAIWLENTEFGDWTTKLWRSPSKNVPRTCELASAVTVGNEYLAAFARQHNPNTSIVRTSVDLDQFPVLPLRKSAAPFTIVWMGSRATLQYLDSARPALERLGARMPIRLRVICNDPPPPYENVSLDFVKFSTSVEVRALAEGDVGIMPLPDTPTSRGKCGLKALQYMAVGRATVVSPVGINREIIRDGENGLWADSTDEWVAQLERLARDPALRQRLADAGRRTIETGYTARHSANAFAEAVRSALATPS